MRPLSLVSTLLLALLYAGSSSGATPSASQLSGQDATFTAAPDANAEILPVASGVWTSRSIGAPWQDGFVPTAQQRVRIPKGFTLTVPAGAHVGHVTVEGTLRLEGSCEIEQLTAVQGANIIQGDDADLRFRHDVTLAPGTFTRAHGRGRILLLGDLTLDSNGQDMGNVIIGASPDATTLASDFSATNLTINSGDFLYTKGYELTLSGNLVIVGSGTLDATDTAPSNEGDGSLIKVGGNFMLDYTTSTFVAATSTVVFNGAAAQLVNVQGQAFMTVASSNTSSGGVKFISSFSATNFLVETLSASATVYFNANSTVTITGRFAPVGSAAKYVVLRSTTAGTYWYLNVSGGATQSVTYVDAQDSNAGSGATISAGNGTDVDSSHNVNWDFGSCAFRTSVQSGLWSSASTWNTGVPPVQCSSITIASGHTVTVDVSTATSGAISVSGTLSFSRVVSSTLTLVGGGITLASGSTLDMGTQASPIPSGITAKILLATGTSSGQYPLYVGSGSAFRTWGAEKSRVAYPTANAGATSVQVAGSGTTGWAVGDTILITQSEKSGTSQNEQRTITSMSGTNPVTVNWSGSLSNPHISSNTFEVLNLTRNVVIQSSGTGTDVTNVQFNLGSNDLAVVTNTEFNGLDGPVAGFRDLSGSGKLVVSSSTINGGSGVYCLSSSAVFRYLASNTLLRAYSGRVEHSNAIQFLAQTNATWVDVVSAGGWANYGLYLNSAVNFWGDNLIVHGNYFDGFSMDGANLRVSRLYSFGNARYSGLNSATGLSYCIGCSYSVAPNGNYVGNGTEFHPAGQFYFRNPTFPGGLNFGAEPAGSFGVISEYGGEQGVLRAFGDFNVSNSTVSLRYDTPLFVSTATTPRTRIGTSISALTVPAVYDPYVRTEIITITYNGSGWDVEGSSSGYFGQYTAGSGVAQDIPASNPQFRLQMTFSSPQQYDSAEVMTIKGSGDANVQKKLLFGSLSSGFNNNRSKLTVASSGGFEAVGSGANPTVISLASGGTYYTFVDSGAFSVQYASFTYMDESGIQLSGSGPFAISNSTFDYTGNQNGASTTTLLSLNGVTQSTISVTFVTFGGNTATGTSNKYNYTISGSSTGLSWTNYSYTGSLVGNANERSDPSNKISWAPTGCSTFTAVANGNWSAASTWDSLTVPTTCNPVVIPAGKTVTVEVSTAVASTTTVSGTLSFSRVTSSTLTIVGGDLTVKTGGTLDLGTAASPINASSATLILAYGTGVTQYGLTVQNGGALNTWGSAKAPASGATASVAAGATSVTVSDASGWQVGDLVAIDTEPARITSTPAGGTFSFTPAVTINHVVASTSIVRVANLTRNVLIRSSGTVLSGGSANSAYIYAVTALSSTTIVNTEFAYLGGTTSGRDGVRLVGSTGMTLSSSTFHHGYIGAYSQTKDAAVQGVVAAWNADAGFVHFGETGAQFNDSSFLGNATHGLDIDYLCMTSSVTRSFAYGNGGVGLYFGNAVAITVSSSVFYRNTTAGVSLMGSTNRISIEYSTSAANGNGFEVQSSSNRLSGIRAYGNAIGIHLFTAGSAENTIVDAVSQYNTTDGIEVTYGAQRNRIVNVAVSSNLLGAALGTAALNANGNRFVGLVSYGNTSQGLTVTGSTANVCAGCLIGYSTWTVAAANGTDVFYGSVSSTQTWMFRGGRIGGLSLANSVNGGSLVQMSPYGSTGTVVVYGDYVIDASTLSLRYDTPVFRSTATAASMTAGSGSTHAIDTITTSDASTLDELITATALNATTWRVSGTQSGLLDGAFSCSAASNCSFTNARVNFTLRTGATVSPGDTLDFLTMAASADANAPKKLIFGTTGSTFNNGRSRIQVPSSGGFEAVGLSTSPILVTMSGGGTYYTFVDSGPFAVQYASFTYMDENGIQLNGSGPFTIADSTFDYTGNRTGASTTTLLTLNGVTQSTINVTNVTFGSNTAAGTSNKYNYTILGSSTGLSWSNQFYSGGLTGNSNERSDPDGHINWPVVSVNTCQTVTSVGSAGWNTASTWDTGFVPTSCNAVVIAGGTSVTVDAANAAASTTTISGTLSFSRVASSTLTIVGGNVTVSAGGTLDMGTQASAIRGSSATLVLAYGAAAGQYGLIVNNGGNFSVYGSSKAPAVWAEGDALSGATSVSVTTAGLGWTIGDDVTIGQSEFGASWADQTERRTLTSVGANSIGWSGGLTYNHRSTDTFRLANLSRNVLVRSSGTNVATNTAYIRSLAQNATSFAATYGEFAYLGTAVGVVPSIFGVTFDGGKGSISSSTIREGYCGVTLLGSPNNTIANNVFYKGFGPGIAVFTDGTGVTLSGNDAFGGTYQGLWSNANSVTMSGNFVYSNGLDGIQFDNVNGTATGNRVFVNAANGILYSTSTTGTATQNVIWRNGSTAGIALYNSLGVNASSNTLIRDGIGVHKMGGNTVGWNTMTRPAGSGLALALATVGNEIIGNTITNAGDTGMTLNGAYFNRITSNTVSGTATPGIYILGSDSNTFVNNTVTGAGDQGMSFSSSHFNRVAGSRVSGSASIGFTLYYSSYNTVMDLYSSGNGSAGIYVNGGAGNLVADSVLGYTPAGASQPNTFAEYFQDSAAPSQMTLRRVRMNSLGVGTSVFNVANNGLADYSHDLATGTLRIYGDYQVSNSTLSLQYSTNSYAASATTPKLVRGTNHSAVVSGVSDTNALNQIITATFDGANWVVTGSSTPGTLCTITGASGSASCGSPAQFTLTVTGSSPASGDALDFALLASAQDAGVQKQLLIGPSAAGFNSGRTRIGVASTGGFSLVGVSTAPTIMTRLDTGSTYYTFTDSGAFTIQNASITWMDEMGLQINGGGATLVMSSSTFDIPNTWWTATTSATYLTANALTASATFYNMTFANSLSQQKLYNVNAVGAFTAGKTWTFATYQGVRAGANYTAGTNASKILWTTAVDCSTRTSVGSGAWSSAATWDYGVPTSCTPALIQSGHVVTVDVWTATASTTTVAGTLSFSRIVSSTLTLVGGNMTVASGGTLDMGTAASPINASSATLILAYGATGGQYGLIVNTGGNFTVRGAAKSPWTRLSGSGSIGTGTTGVPFTVADASGWAVGDTVTIDTEAVTITGISGNQITGITPGLGQIHYATFPVIVANLSRSVLVRSSGTNTTQNSSFIQNFATNATSFALTYGEFAYLGSWAGGSKNGIYFGAGSTAGSISSSTVRQAYLALDSRGAGSVFTGNNFFASETTGVSLGALDQFYGNNVYATAGLLGSDPGLAVWGWSAGKNALLQSNNVFRNAYVGIEVAAGPYNRFVGNAVYANGLQGILVDAVPRGNGAADYNVFERNAVYGNGSDGIKLDGSANNLLAGNDIYSQAGASKAGIRLSNGSNDNMLVGNRIYSNAIGLYSEANSVRNTCVACAIGYSSMSVSLPNTSDAFVNADGTTNNWKLKATLINPSPGVDTTKFASTGTYVVAYSTNPGLVYVYGDYRVSGSTFSLEYATDSYASAATTPISVRGNSSASVISTSDAYAVSQLVTLSFNGVDWDVTGSSTGTMGHISAGSNQSIPTAGSAHAVVNVTNSSPASGDVIAFVIAAAAGDANQPKKLYFGKAATAGSTWNNNTGRSKVSVASGAGFRAIGTAGSPSLITMAGGSTYYTFVDSGAFTVQYASFTYMDENGIQLNGSGPFSIANSTFDYAGNQNGASTSTLLTLNGVTQSTITLADVTYGANAAAGTSNKYNYTILGSSTGLSWTNQLYSGGLAGDAYERSDPQGHVTWAAMGCSTFTSVASGLWSAAGTWDSGIVPTSCNPVVVASGKTVTIDIGSAVASTTSVSGTLSFSRVANSTLTVVGGNMTVAAGGTLDMGTSASPISTSSATLILAYGAAAGQYGLTINNGGNFLVYGATKAISSQLNPVAATVASGVTTITVAEGTGWRIGDTVLIDSEPVTITSNPGSNQFGISGTAVAHVSVATAPVRVTNITRTVLVRSSGTTTGSSGNAAYLRTLVANATSFALNFGEFAYFGETTGQSGKYGMTFDGAATKGSLSSSTVRDSYQGVRTISASGLTLIGNVLFRNSDSGLYIGGGGSHQVTGNWIVGNGAQGVYAAISSLNRFSNNVVFSNTGIGIYHNSSTGDELRSNVFAGNDSGMREASSRTLMQGNTFYSNVSAGVFLYNCSNGRVVSNTFYGNLNGIANQLGSYMTVYGNSVTGSSIVGLGLTYGSHDFLVVDNTVTGNASSGIGVVRIVGGGSSPYNHTLVHNAVYGNSGPAFEFQEASGTVIASGLIGYSAPGVLSANTGNDLWINGGSYASDVILRGSFLNKAPFLNAAVAGAGVIAYNLNFATGTVRVYGDYIITGSTLSLTYAANVLASTATSARVTAGLNNHAIASVVTSDTLAVDELITVTATDSSHWSVTGSSSGILNASFVCAASGSCSFTSSPVNFTLLPAGTVTTGDTIDFVTLAATRDANKNKSLYFSTGTSGFNNGRSRLIVAQGAGFTAVGQNAANPTLVTMLGGATYYTFVDSGAFTVQYASFTYMDENGIQLNGSGPFSIANSTFDYMGRNSVSTGTLFTLNGVTQSTITLSDVTYGSNGAAGFTNKYNYTILGSSTGLSWTNYFYSGGLAGDSFERSDPDGHVTWAPVGCSTFTSVLSGAWSAGTTWNSGLVPSSCNPIVIGAGTTVTVDISTAVASTTTVNGTLSFSRVVSSTLTLVGGNITVAAGGTLDLGTAASPINASSATLVLAAGQAAAQYGLTIQNGGNASFYGSPKTVATTVTATANAGDTTLTIDNSGLTGWRVGDAIIVSPTNVRGSDQVERRVISNLSGTTLTLGDFEGSGVALSYLHAATHTVWVANLSRNVVVRSSGTNVAANSAYVRALNTATTSFVAAYAEFAYLGKSGCTSADCGVTFDGASGFVSSATFHDGHQGFRAAYASSVTFTGNIVYKNAHEGIVSDTVPGMVLDSNYVASNGRNGFYFADSPRSLIRGNELVSNGLAGGVFSGSSNGSLLRANKAHSNAMEGLYLAASNNAYFVENETFLNGQDGLSLHFTSNPVWLGNATYGNGNAGMIIRAVSGGQWMGGYLGRRSDGTGSANGAGEVLLDNTQASQILLKGASIGGSVPFPASGFAQAGSYALSYGANFATGTVHLYGDYTVSGATMTLDYAAQNYAAAVTSGRLLRGTGHAITSATPSDANTLSEYVTVTYTGANSWQVVGSSSGILGTVTCAAGATGCSFADAKLSFTMDAGASTAVGDQLDLVTTAASGDANVQKRLLFGTTALSGTRSVLRIEAGSGFHAVGTSGVPTTVSALSGATYYTFIDSGVFTVQYASFTYMDENGIQLNGSGPFSIANSTFDYLGSGSVSTGTLFTLNGVTQSTVTLTDVTYGSNGATGLTNKYNYTILGSSTGLSWTNQLYNGALAGDSFERSDPDGHVTWAPVGCSTFTSVVSGPWSATATWDSSLVPTSCNPVVIATGKTVTVDISSAVASTTTINGTLSFSRVVSSTLTLVGGNMTVNAAGTLDMGTSASPLAASSATLVLAYGASAGQFGLIVSTGGNLTAHGVARSPAGSAVSVSATDLTLPATAAIGWSVGDVISIGQNNGNSNVRETELRAIDSVTPGNPVTVAWTGALTYVHDLSSGPIRVTNLSRNVLIRSSGTSMGSNSAYLRSLVANATSFDVRYAEVAYLGANSTDRWGVTLAGQASLSSSTFHHGYDGLYLTAAASSNTFSGNVFYGNAGAGIVIQDAVRNQIVDSDIVASIDSAINLSGAHGTVISGDYMYSNNYGVYPVDSNYVRVTSNTLSGNLGGGFSSWNIWRSSITDNAINFNRVGGAKLAGSELVFSRNSVRSNALGVFARGVELSGSGTLIDSNVIYGNGHDGLLAQGERNTILNNTVDSNQEHGIFVYDGAFNMVVGNRVSRTALASGVGKGIHIDAAPNAVLVDNISYGHGQEGLWIISSTNVVVSGGALGYDASGTSQPDTTAEVSMDPGWAAYVRLRGVRVNPSPGILSTGMARIGNYLLSYNQSFDTGTVRLYGDYTVSGSTFTLDYASYTALSTASAPKLLFGTGHSAVVKATSDADAVSQRIALTYNATSGQWDVTGSSSGAMGSIPSGSDQNIPTSGNVQAVVNITAGTPADGDTIDFALMAAQGGLNRKKQLLMATSASGFNSGRARLTVAPAAGFVATGTVAEPTLITMLGVSGATYYTFVDSGAFTVQYASFTYMDESGIQLNGSGPFSIANSTFDYIGSGSISTGTLFTLNGVTQSTITLTDVTYGSNGAAGLTNKYNYTILGSSTGLSWTNQLYNGGLVGDAYERSDPQGHVTWAPVGCSTFTSVVGGMWSATTTWDSGMVPSSCNPVMIAAGHTVTLDLSTAFASTTTVAGRLSFSRVVSSTLTLVGGNMTVAAGGTVDMGTAASPVNASSATLVLAYGASAGQYGLIVNNGGNLLVYGAGKTPTTTATQDPSGTALNVVPADVVSWSTGDVITISQTESVATDQTEARRIAGISGGQITLDSYAGSPAALQYPHVSSWTVFVANLTRNVVIRSSGTDSANNTAYIRNLARAATSFDLANAEFAYLGSTTSTRTGISFETSANLGSISSSTIHEGFPGLSVVDSGAGNRFVGNVFYKQWLAASYGTGTTIANNHFANSGVDARGSNHTITGNTFYSCALVNGSAISLVVVDHAIVSSNTITASGVSGGSGFTLYNLTNSVISRNRMYRMGAGVLQSSGYSTQNTFFGNEFYALSVVGMRLTSDSSGITTNLLVDNNFYQNNGAFQGRSTFFGNTLVNNHFWSNSTAYNVDGSTANVCAGCQIGYSTSGVSAADTTAIAFNNTLTGNLVLRNSRINPAGAIQTSNLAQAGSYLVQYSTQTRTVQVNGDYTVTGSTLSLDYASALYTSTATAPKLMRGTGHSATVTWTNDTTAVDQLITLTGSSGQWIVTGSSTPGTICTVAQGAANADCGMFRISMSNTAPADGDTIDFALLSGSGDANQPKKLLVGSAATSGSTWNNNTGRSRITVAPGAGFSAQGSAGNPTTVTLASGSTYYTFVDSGAFTVQYASFTDMDENGIQLNGSGPFSIANSTFDYLGSGSVSTGTLFTLNGVTQSTITLTGVTYGSNGAAGLTNKYNYTILGSSTGLSWTNFNYDGGLTGTTYERNDSGNKISWAAELPSRYWVLGSGTGNWSTAANWSTTSGGAGGAGAPGPGQDAIFDGNGRGNCLIDQAVTISTMVVSTSTTGGFTGSIDTSSNTIALSTFTMANGTFYARTSTMTIAALQMSSGTFDAGSSSLAVTGVHLNFGTFNLGGSTMSVAGNWWSDHLHVTFLGGTGRLRLTGTGTAFDPTWIDLYDLEITGQISIPSQQVNVSGQLVLSGTATIASYLDLKPGATSILTGVLNSSPTGALIVEDDAQVDTAGVLNANVEFYFNLPTQTIPARSYGGYVYVVSQADTAVTLGAGTFRIGDYFAFLASGGALAVDAATHNPTVIVGGQFYLDGGGSIVPTLEAGTGAWTIGAEAYLSSGTFNASSASITFSSNVILSGTVFNAQTSSITVGGNWSLSAGGFNAGTSSVTFAGAAGSTSTLTGSTTFYHFVVATSSKNIVLIAGSTTTVQGRFTSTGTTGNLVAFKSSSLGTRAWLVNSGTNNVTYTSARDIDSSGGTTIDAGSTSLNLGNTINWSFGSNGNFFLLFE